MIILIKNCSLKKILLAVALIYYQYYIFNIWLIKLKWTDGYQNLSAVHVRSLYWCGMFLHQSKCSKWCDMYFHHKNYLVLIIVLVNLFTKEPQLRPCQCQTHEGANMFLFFHIIPVSDKGQAVVCYKYTTSINHIDTNFPPIHHT